MPTTSKAPSKRGGKRAEGGSAPPPSHNSRRPATSPHDRRFSDPELYINREIAQVSFIRRVLEEAQSMRHPLLERVKFLSFVSSQLDEFIMIRVAGLRDQVAAQVQETGPDGLL